MSAEDSADDPAGRSQVVDLPLTGVRVLDAVDGPLQSVGRVLADLGADVLRVERQGGSSARTSGVIRDGRSLTFDIRNAGKGSVEIDLDSDAGVERYLALAADADVLLRDADPSVAADQGLTADRLRAANPRLVIVNLSDFGSTGDRSGWRGTPDVHSALSTVLSRSGLPDVAEPLLPPEFLMYESAAVQAVWLVLLELAHVRATGLGDVADFSVQEGLIQILDPIFGVGGSARAGVPLRDLPRGRPDSRHLYPIFAAKDGWVRICVLSKRQWQGMFEWLGRPDEFSDPKYDNTMARFGAAGRLYPLFGELFANLTQQEAVEQGQQLGVPTAALAAASDVLREPAFQGNGSFIESPTEGVLTHSGWFEIDDQRVGFRAPAPELGSTRHFAPREVDLQQPARGVGRPFEGLRVLDLGVIVVGSELGRLFADYGADVIKIESSAFPDGARQSPGGEIITEGSSWGMRNKRSLGLNLRTDSGRRIFAGLVQKSDIILTNFKPGTLGSLGFDMDALQTLNPGVILSESSAFGNHGPWSRRLGYGPLVRASAGLSALWAYPDVDNGFSDAITIFPDHVVARLNAAAIVALLLRRDRTGRGGRVSTAQVDAIFGAMADLLLADALEPGSGVRNVGNDRPGDAFRGVFAAAGEDEWLVVDAVGDEAFAATARVIGHPELTDEPGLATATGRWAERGRLRELLADWARMRTPSEAARILQESAVPAGPMMRLDDIETDSHLLSRGAFGLLHQPQFDQPLVTNLGEARTTTLAPPRLGPAPLAAENTREVLREVLDLDDVEIQRLIDDGSLEEHPTAAPTRAAQAPQTTRA